ncbi:glycosyltransferase family 2 protein [Candidatus Woesearchaeota archaeon]|nr:MAG: glycosyltransferase family 2 protein [Candidatus Woesearchaeota archaeon]
MEFFKIIIWIAYFIGLYIAIFFLMHFLDVKASLKKDKEQKPLLKTHPLVSVVIPAFNEEKSIRMTLESALALDYPKDKVEILVINDCSTDRTAEIVKAVITEHSNRSIKLVNNPVNKGKATSMNLAMNMLKGEYFACLDADSIVDKDALKNSMYTHQQEKPAIVTPVMKVNNPKTLLQKFQRLEYVTAMFVANLVGYLDCNYVAPGPFSVYKTKIIKDVGGFDEKSIVEDQEIAYRVQAKHYKIKQCPRAFVNTITPENFEGFKKQRNRWSKGTLLNLLKYKRMFLNKKYGDFGVFQLPLNVLYFLLSMLVMTSFFYYIVRPFFNAIYNLYLINFDVLPYLKSFTYSFNPLQIDITSTFIIYLSLILSIMVLYLASRMGNESVKKYGLVSIIPYFIMYFVITSFINVQVLWELAVGRKTQKW